MDNSPQNHKAPHKPSIVIIDDEVDLCFLLSSMLKAQGYNTTSFYTLQSGLEGIKALQPEWVVIDNNLPDGLGWERVNDIIDTVPQVNIIKISANPDSYRARHREFVHYLIKPINANSIIALIHKTAVNGQG